MKGLLIASLIMIMSCPAAVFCQRPMTSARDNPSQVQWNSHQMNQPAPPRRNLSEERLDDIRRLYDQALEESRSANQQNPVQHTPRPNAASGN